MIDDSVRAQVNSPWPRLAALPSTTFKLVSGTIVIWFTTAFMFLLIWRLSGGVAPHEQIIMSLVDSLLLFVATVAGVVPAAQWATKRLSFKPGGPDDKRSDLDRGAAALDASEDVSDTPIAPRTAPETVDVAASAAPAQSAPSVQSSQAIGAAVPGTGD